MSWDAHEERQDFMKISINGKQRFYKGPAFKRLIDVLREDFGLTGTKEGCGEGECGACTVLLDNKPVASCLIPIEHAEGRKVETVESLAPGKALNPLQKSFLEEAAAQCGICTPGILLTPGPGSGPEARRTAKPSGATFPATCAGARGIRASWTRWSRR